VHLRLDTDTRLAADIESADAFRTVGLVRGEGHQIDFPLFEIDIHLSGRLRGVAMENNALRAAQFTDLLNRLDDADFIIHQHHGYQNRVRTNRFL
jgi:hypothetical protein